MKNTRFILVMVAVLAVGMGLASAQITGEPMEGKSRNHTGSGSGNAFGCQTTGNAGSPPCSDVAGATIRYRFYSPDNSNGSINANVDGNPIFQTAALGSYLSDIDNSANYFGAGHSANVQVNLVWDGQLRGGSGDHAGYYMAQSQLITTNGETGNTNRADCAGTRGIACFSAGSGNSASDPTDAPQGTIVREGGMRGIPVPTVTDGGTTGQVTLGWGDTTNEYTTDGASGPIAGANLYVFADAGVLDSRAVTDGSLDGGAVFNSFHAKGSDGSAVLTCAGLGDPGTYIPVIKIAYQDNDQGANPVESAFFSANGPTIRCDAGLFTEVVNFNASYGGRVKGDHFVEVSWDTTTEDGTIAFNILRGTALQGPFTKVGTLQAQGQGGEGSSYYFEDLFKVPGNVGQVFYQLQIIEADGSDQAVGPVRSTLEKQTGRKN